MNFITNLNQIAEGFLTSYAWPVLWQTALLVVIITVASWTFFRKASPQFRYLLWLLVLVRLALPPAAYLPTGIGNWGRALLDFLPPSGPQGQMEGKGEKAPPPPVFLHLPDAAISEYGVASKDFAAASAPPAPVLLSKHALLLLAWAAGTAGLLSFLLIRLIRFHYLLRGAALPDEALSRCVADYARRLGMRRDVKVRVTDTPYGPIVCGFLRPVIVLPKRILLELSQEELAPVLIHELAHVKRGDWLVNWLQVLSGILYFFHPFLWYANRQIRQEREKACDDLVLVAVRLDRKGYVNSLMRVRDRVEGAFARACGDRGTPEQPVGAHSADFGPAHPPLGKTLVPFRSDADRLRLLLSHVHAQSPAQRARKPNEFRREPAAFRRGPGCGPSYPGENHLRHRQRRQGPAPGEYRGSSVAVLESVGFHGCPAGKHKDRSRREVRV
jgi:beta-lactamase regulating signal transducer with metallopeptidase domain